MNQELDRKEPHLDLNSLSQVPISKTINDSKRPNKYKKIFIILFIFFSLIFYFKLNIEYIFYNIGFIKLDSIEIKDRIKKCWNNSENYSLCTKLYLEKNLNNISDDPELSGIYGTILSLEEKHQESLKYLDFSSKHHQLNRSGELRRCYSNYVTKRYSESIISCFKTLPNSERVSLKELDTVEIIVNSLFNESRFNEGITILNSYHRTTTDLHTLTTIKDLFRLSLKNQGVRMTRNSENGNELTNHNDIYSFQLPIPVWGRERMFVLTGSLDGNNYELFQLDPNSKVTYFSQDILNRSTSNYKVLKTSTVLDSKTNKLFKVKDIILDKFYLGYLKFEKLEVIVCEANCPNVIGTSLLEKLNIKDEIIEGIHFKKLISLK